MRWAVCTLLVAATVEVALFDGFALVELLFAFAGGNDELDVTAAGEELDWDELKAVLFGAGESRELFFGGEEFDVLFGFGAEGEVVKPKFTFFKCDEGAAELNMMVADETDFGAGQNHAAGELVAEMVIKPGAAIDGDGSGLL